MLKWFIYTCVLVAVIVAGFVYLTPAPLLKTGPDTTAERVTFKSPDELKISGSLYIPKTDSKVPVFILSHQNNASRVQYNFLVPLLLKRGFAVLAYDTRGFGKSQGDRNDYNRAPLDISGALDYLEKDERIDPFKMYAIGASMGANIVYVATALDPRLSYALVLSPSDHALASLEELSIVNQPRNVTIVATEEDGYSNPQSLFDRAVFPKELIMYKGNRHGVQLLQGIKQEELLALLLKLK